MAIANHRIGNQESFIQVTSEPHQVAGLYFYQQLDCLFEVAYHVACDFFRRPHLYTQLEPPIAPTLAKLHAQYGTDERLPGLEQRHAIYLSIFGHLSTTDTRGLDENFIRLRDELLDAAKAFAERVFETGQDMLRERVRSAHRPLQEYLRGLQGDSVRWSKDEALSSLSEQTTYAILRNAGVAAVFGIARAPQTSWPYEEDSNADKLVEEVSKSVMPSEKLMTRQHFSIQQRAALRGAEAIATVIDFDERKADVADLDVLITKCYTWRSTLQGAGT